MAPVVCDFDLMARLAAYSVEDNYEVHGGDDPAQPKIVVTPCNKDEEEFNARLTSMPHTPRPPLEEEDEDTQ
jgi:hypothetical protein